MAFSKNRRLADFIAGDGTIPTGKFATGTITSAHIADAAIVPGDLHATLDLTGKTITVANASTGDSDTTVANTAFVQQEIAALVDSSPSALNTLNELAAALGDDANFSTTVTNSIATKLPLAGGTLTGNVLSGNKVGLTDTNTGHAIAPGGLVYHTTDGTLVQSLNRLTDDGPVIRLVGNTTTAGSIGVLSGGLSFGSGTSMTTRMVIDSLGNVAIGNPSAFGTVSNRTVLSVNGTSSATLNIGTGGSQKAYYYTDGSFAQVSTMGTIPLRLGVNDSEKIRIAGATGNVSIGTSADASTWAKLEVLGTAGAQTGANQTLYVRASTATANEGVGIRMSAASGSHEAVGIIGMVNNASGNAGSMTFHTYNLGATIPEVMRLDNKGNLGLGVVPTANWWANATALQISPTASLWNTSNYEDFNIGNNVYTDGTDKYLQNDAACKIRLTDAGLMDFRVASAGSAGNAISFITALAIDSAGVVYIDASQGKAAGKYDMEIGNASKSHGVFLRPYMFFGTRYSAWDTNLGWNCSADAMSTNSGIVQGTGYGASGASNLIVGADTLSWYRWAPAQCTGLGASLAVNSTYLYMQASTSGFNIKGNYASNASDRRLKDNITPITNALDKVKQLTGNTFTWKTTLPSTGIPIPEHKAGKADMGVIAQEVQAVVPTAVQLSPWDSYIKEVDNPNFNGDLETGGPQKISDPAGFTSVTGEDYLTVNEEKLVPLLIEAIKELEARVAELEG